MQFKDGDVIRWRYKDTKGMFEPYWCKSCFAVFSGVYDNEPVFLDMFWTSPTDRSQVHLDKIEFEYIGNLNDYSPCTLADFDYYDDKDCLDLRHGNDRSATYIRNGASKSVEKIRQVLLKQAQEVEMKIESSKYKLQQIEEKLKSVTVETWI